MPVPLIVAVYSSSATTTTITLCASNCQRAMGAAFR
jgi:hypothetical protein